MSALTEGNEKLIAIQSVLMDHFQMQSPNVRIQYAPNFQRNQKENLFTTSFCHLIERYQIIVV